MKVALDCDGVLADFVSAALDIVEEHTGVKRSPEEVTEHNIFKALGVPHLREKLYEKAKDPDWILGFKEFNGAFDFVEKLRMFSEVIIVTSPLKALGWVYGRTAWLHMMLGFADDEIVFASGKHHIKADVLVDDMVENCLKYAKHHPTSLVILWDAPYNRSVTSLPANVVRSSTWSHALELIQEKAKNIETSY